MRKLLKYWDDPDHGYGPARFWPSYGGYQPTNYRRPTGKRRPKGPITASGKSWRVLAKQRGTYRDIGDGTPRKDRTP